MTKEAVTFSGTPRPTWKEFNDTDKYPCVDYLKLRKELVTLQNQITITDPIYGGTNLSPAQHKRMKELERKLADAPPDPVLPPPAALIKVSGKLEAFSARLIPHYFDPEAYPQTHGYFTRQQERVAKAAVVVAAAGQGAAAQGMLLEGNRLSRLAWYVTGKINGKHFSGWLGYTFCQPGEEVELIVAPVGDEYLVYALSKPQERSITMTPGCYRGKRQARWGGTWFWFGMLIFIWLGMIATWLFTDGFKGIFDPELYTAILVGSLLGGTPIVGPALYSVWRRHPFPQEDLAEEIFTVMGWKNVTDINLVKLNRRRKRQWRRTGKPDNPFKEQTPFLYTGWGREFYYY
ncbi:putative type VI secretion system effector [Scandinavium sp. V105_16]|uniref:Type VI secretion system effector n=1 Tax=Scandinavium lactucae TaxID=3095028 RepID=A0AAJ2VRM9_9ENTR|nr:MULTISPECIES: putative type VI secretion system effector [unclassified Scandinavium]MDX6018862.1 putative type VI secretion system effector [Scandinavium sp. V105_16]MDX6030176.1 putative type VI secretion system effector [Scandinavium sp. V105_12]